MERLRAFFSGRVQGVGFRWHTEHLAAGFEVSGFVRNLSDGRVELVAEGRPEVLDRFLQAIRDSRLGGNVEGLEQKRGPATGEFKGFGIRETD
jgi:acylphosphatase